MGWGPGELVAKYDVPGAQVAVLANGEIRDEAAGVLSLRTQVEATTDSVFKIGSITKIWTATLIQQLVDDGVLDLDRPVRGSLPGFRLSDPAATASLTARHLLTHTGGIDGNHFTDTGRNDDAIEKFVAILAEADQLLPPDTVFSYSNSGYVVLGRFAQRFTTTVGSPPLTYVTWWRMTTAARLLRDSDIPLRAIAERTGYATEFAFAKAFKREFGTAPGQYRNRVHSIETTA